MFSVVLQVFMADSEQIGFRCPKDIAIAFKRRLKEVEQEKTEYLVALLAKDLGIDQPIPLSDRVEDVEIELKELKQEVSEIKARLDVS